jgi:hypothetical protein
MRKSSEGSSLARIGDALPTNGRATSDQSRLVRKSANLLSGTNGVKSVAHKKGRVRMQRIFPRAVLACLSEGRPPRPFETESVAAKIWSEAFALSSTNMSWSDVPRGSPAYRRTMAAALTALGCEPIPMEWPAAA